MNVWMQILLAVLAFFAALGFAACVIDGFIAWTMRRHRYHLYRFERLRKGGQA